jgi:hypothetical protein
VGGFSFFPTNSMEEPKLPDYFPLKLKKCAIPADDFFACFETSADNGDKNALLQCSAQLKLYKDCMDSLMQKRQKRSWWFF